MKLAKIIAGALVVFVVGVALLWQRSDDRLVGEYVPDVPSTYPEWNRQLGFAEETVEGALHHVFNSQPMVFTGNKIQFSTTNGVVTRRMLILWKSRNATLVGYSLSSLYRLEYAPDGLWVRQQRIFGLPKIVLPIKMTKVIQEPDG
ncbi:MAG: hypothetical protein M5U15_06190 [Kiritimatiellae bacterium]|nr:hypothetical protein [Kiritimatiellia bacterium]